MTKKTIRLIDSFHKPEHATILGYRLWQADVWAGTVLDNDREFDWNDVGKRADRIRRKYEGRATGLLMFRDVHILVEEYEWLRKTSLRLKT